MPDPQQPQLDATLWKKKLVAYLHDSPSKVFDIPSHRERSISAAKRAGIPEEEVEQFLKECDWTAAAADRFPFPSSQQSGLRSVFDGQRACFHHPLCARQLTFHRVFKSIQEAEESESQSQVDGFRTSEAHFSGPGEHWRARFFMQWRLWPQYAREKDYRWAFVPADTRLPDHTVWNHMAVAAALQGAASGNELAPAFLRLKIGGVQDFIAAARSIRDLWSGSYLLSWLMIAGLKELSARIGPDAVIFPSLRDQPIFDLQWRNELWRRIRAQEDADPAWNSLEWRDDDFLISGIPNVFLAIVPADRAKELAEAAVAAIRNEWRRIADAVWRWCDKEKLCEAEGAFSKELREQRFNAQIESAFDIGWQVTPWPSSIDEAIRIAREAPALNDKPARSTGSDGLSALERVEKIIEGVTTPDKERAFIPPEHRDKRFYEGRQVDGPNCKLNNVGIAWALINGINDWELNGVRQTHAFASAPSNEDGGSSWRGGTHAEKDSLTGREEAVAGGRVWAERARKRDGTRNRFKHEDWLSASTLVKRVWDIAYLEKKYEFKRRQMPSTHDLARHCAPNDEDEADVDEVNQEGGYFAVLALDGDQMGKWVSGEKTPKFASQFSNYSDGSDSQRSGAYAYFKHPERASILELQRPISPSYHLQFSEALANFGLRAAPEIVQAYEGYLIYAGGDDVLAMLPADTALDCAEALRMAFRGDPGLASFLRKTSKKQVGLSVTQEGFLEHEGYQDESGRNIPFIVPGPAADVSVGIAIAHSRSPLQDAVRAAQAAEKDAKNKHQRSAVAFRVLKRSGEHVHWGCKWEKSGIKLLRECLRLMGSKELTGRFPYRLIQLVEPYGGQSPVSLDQLKQILSCDFDYCMRQHADSFPQELTDLFREYLESVNEVNSDAPEQETARRLVSETIYFAQTLGWFARALTENPKAKPHESAATQA